MKRIITILAAFCISLSLFAQNTPVVEKAAPQSNNTLPSGGTLGSNSGVNPMGNPGTIANSSGNSSSINNTLAPHPNIEPGTFLNSSPEGTVITTTISNGTVSQKTAIVNNNSGTSAAAVKDSAGVTVKNTSPVTKPVVKDEVVIKTAPPINPAPDIKKDNIPVSNKGKTIPAYTPLLGNYVSESTINKIKTKFGPSVYDVRTVKMNSTSKIAYIVRLVENGKFRTELYYDEP